MSQPLKDPIFLDRTKLDSYCEQAFGKLTEIDPEVRTSFELGLTGLKVKLEETNKTRPLTDFEKIDLIVKFLQSEESIVTARPKNRHENVDWVLETTDAYRVVVPASPNPERETPSLAFWLSPGNDEVGILCAVEGASGDEARSYDYSRASTYSVLQSLVYFSRQQQRAGVLNLKFPSDPHPNPYVKVDDDHPPSLVHEHHNVVDFASEFVKAPVELLTKWRCICSEIRNVTIVYRVREYGPDTGYDWSKVSTFGYALCVYA